MSGPERHLLAHRAPEGLLEAAHRRAAQRPRGWRPRTVVLAMAATLLVGLAGGAWLARSSAPLPAEVASQGPVLAAAQALAEREEAQPVRLVCYAPQAEQVSVAGSFNAWDVQGAPMRQVGDGLFAAELLLPVGRYEYMFVVDGDRWVPDPSAPLAADDGFGQRNSVIEI